MYTLSSLIASFNSWFRILESVTVNVRFVLRLK